VRVRKVEGDIATLVGRQEMLRDQVRRDAPSFRQREPERPLTRERDLGIEIGRR